jgi:hypothetical protein
MSNRTTKRDGLVCFLSGEFVLARRPNGGTAVFLRSLWVTFLLVAFVLPAKAYLAKNTVLSFSASQLKVELGSVIPWAGAIFAAAYAAFYARFSAQWNYLASLYNQLMQVVVGMTHEEIEANENLHLWYAAFIEDAQDLHLANKSTFASMIIGLLREPYVVRAFVDGTENGDARLKSLERILNFTAHSYVADWECVRAARPPISSSIARRRALLRG